MTSENPTKQLHQQADAFLNGGRMFEARKLYEQICSLDENDADAWLMKGAIDGETGKVNDAVLHVKKAIAINPGYADAYHTLAHLLVSLGNIDEAGDSLRKAVELDPEYVEAWVMLAGIQGQLQHYVEAEACSRQALQLDDSIVEAHMSLGNALSSQESSEDAVASYRTATRLQPGLQMAWSRLGIVQAQLNDLDAAEKALNKALSLNPNDVQAQVYKARILISREQLESATEQLQAILRANPDNEEAWKNLVIACTQSGKPEAWIDFCKQLTQLHPNSGQVWLGLGYALEHNESLERAVESYRKATDLAPHLHDAWSRKGVVCARQDRLDEAQEYFREALARGSKAAVTHCGYGSILSRKGWLEESEEHLRLAIEKAPEWPPGFIALSRVLLDQGHFQEALDMLKRAMLLDPESEDAAARLAQVYERMGMHEEGYAVLEPFLGGDDTNSQIVCTFAILSGALDRQEEALSRIGEMLKKSSSFSAHQKLDLNFRAAEIHSTQKNHDKAMFYCHRWNELKPVVYDSHSHHRFVSDTITLFSRDVMAMLPHASTTSSRPVFIVGMPRSGTSLVEQILSCHSQVYGAGELMEIGNAASTLGFRPDRPVPTAGHFGSMPQDTLENISAGYLAKLESLSSGEARVTDKMPGNFIYLGLIQLLFPNARIIHMQRDPLDTCLSCYFTNFNGIHDYAYDLGNLGHYYCEYQRLMNHWRGSLSLPFLDVNYESLVENPEDVSRTLVEFCGLDWDPKVLEFHKSKRLVNTASYQQTKKPVYTSSIARWKRYDKHLGPLRDALNTCSQD